MTVEEAFSPARILVVEDESIVAVDIAARLLRLGHRVVGTARSAEAALALYQEHRPELVLMDIRLEGEADGIDAALRLRSLGDVGVVFLTAYADAETLGRARAAAPLGYVVKPFDQRDFEVTVQMGIGRFRLHRELQRAHDDMKAVLDAQRQGTLLVSADDTIAFASRAALRLLRCEVSAVTGRRWQDVLPMTRSDLARLERAVRSPRKQVGNLAVELRWGETSAMPVEIEVREDVRAAGGTLLFLHDVSRVVRLERLLDEKTRVGQVIGSSALMQRVALLVRDYARVDVPVLIDGETGVGKELAARSIHDASARRARPFVAVNCAGLTEELAASQLFGHVRGAFTGATGDYEGLFRTADKGTLFLDEIGELSPRVQATLLRVLDEGLVYSVGRTKGEPVDVRILAATNRDLAREVAEGRFRADLYYRIRAARITLPPLRERKEDIVLLVRHFIDEQSALTRKPLQGAGAEALRLLHLYDWPGNVRELRNTIAAACARAQTDVLVPDDLPGEVVEGAAAAALPKGQTAGRLEVLDALERAGGNRSVAARLLGVSRATFYRRLGQLGFAGGEEESKEDDETVS